MLFYLYLLNQVYASMSADAWFVDIIYVLGKFDELNIVFIQSFNLISCNLNVGVKMAGVLMLSSLPLYFPTHIVL